MFVIGTLIVALIVALGFYVANREPKVTSIFTDTATTYDEIESEYSPYAGRRIGKTARLTVRHR